MLGKYGLSELEAINENDEFYQEARYCIEHQKSLLDFDCWTWLEKCIDKRVPYEVYAAVDDLAEETLIEYSIDEVCQFYEEYGEEEDCEND